MNRIIVVLAPHLEFPLRNGGDIYIASKWGSLDPDVYQVLMLAGDGAWRVGADGRWESVRAWPKPSRRSGAVAVAEMLLTGKDYMSSRFNTPIYLKACREFLRQNPSVANADLVVASFPSADSLQKRIGLKARCRVVETHNFDPKLYLDRALEASGPARRYLSLLAAMRAYRVLRRIPRSVSKIALGSTDATMFESFGIGPVIRSDLGCELFPPRSSFPGGDTIRLSFIGSLSVSMNDSAVRHFVTHHLPDLRRACDRPVIAHVIGSNPSASLRHFLHAASVPLHANVSDAELDRLLAASHASMLPFVDSNGLKLKFWASAARGVPVVSFIEAPEVLHSNPGVLTSGKMSEWARFLVALADDPQYQRTVSEALQSVAAENSWRAAVMRDLRRIERAEATAPEAPCGMPFSEVPAG